GHLVRRLDAVLDLSWLRAELAPYYSHTGCPSIDPELMIRMLLLGYCYSIRSDRRLCQEVDMNLAYRWFCRLGLEGRVPDHSTFSVNRHGRFRDSDILRKVFETVVRGCMKAGLVGGEGFAVDASVIEADASRFQRVEGAEVDWTDEQRAQRPVREYLAALDGEHSPTNPERAPKALSPTDPAAAWTRRGRPKVMFGYSLNYLIDMQEAVIVDVEATPTRISKEVDATEIMIERTEERFALKPRHIAADVAYGTGEMLGWLVDHNIEPHIPVWEQSKVAAKGKFSRADFVYDAENDLYVCPAGKALRTSGTAHDGTTLKYIAKRTDCARCPLKAQCTTGRERRLQRDVNEAARDYARSLTGTEAYRQSAKQRKRIETRFGDVKWNLGLTRLKLRGLTGARDEFLLAATVQNLRRLAKHVIRPPPRPLFA
ncbi:MAG TPA: IS1182 family transposase, partial [Gammaproteobacteria bacterium]|nr:IS1182 family transposase [Gammaproteobacteria bacterium]